MSKDFDLTQRIIPNEDILLKKIDESCVLLNLRNNSYFGLDADGYNFYLKLIEAESIESALKALILEYSVEEVTLKQDLLELIKEMSQADIITIQRLRPSL